MKALGVRTIAVSAVALCFIPLPAFCCTCVSVNYRVKRSFEVRVKSAFDLTGVEVKLFPESGTNVERVSSRVDQNRSATFRNVSAGKYFLSFEPESAGGACSGATLDVGNAGQSTVSLSWSDPSMLRTRALTGRLSIGSAPVSNLPVHVLDLRSQAVVKDGKTSEDGQFAFAAPPGLYALQLKPDKGSRMSELEGDIFVLLDPAASSDSLDIQVGGSSCGLMYSANCPTIQATSSDISDVRGEVVDASGAVIPRAVVSLLSSGNTIASSATDSAGRFHVLGVQAGRYELQVSRPGFQMISTSVNLGRTSTKKSLLITMAVLGSCGGSVSLGNLN